MTDGSTVFLQKNSPGALNCKKPWYNSAIIQSLEMEVSRMKLNARISWILTTGMLLLSMLQRRRAKKEAEEMAETEKRISAIRNG